MVYSGNIIVIDDDEGMRDSCQQVLTRAGYMVRTAKSGQEGLELIKKESFDLVILDLKMPGISGNEVLREIKMYNPEVIVIVITGYPTIESAVESMKNGAYDFLPKPFSSESLRIIVKRAMEKKQLAMEKIFFSRELGMEFESGIIIGKSPGIKKIMELVKKAAITDSTVLITGESGTGKELVARAIHHYSYRKAKPFVPVDCGVLVESLFESELFGHVKGAFTGATAMKYGRFELANGGTIFFDEIGNIDRDLQSKLLRVLQEKEITRVGSSQVVKIDVRVVAATNCDLCKKIAEGTFREDLYYRLNVIPMELPPLRERKEDIPLLAKFFLKKHGSKRKNRLPTFSSRSIEAFMQHVWPGNVRELENAIERAIALSEGDIIEPEDIFYFDLPVFNGESTETIGEIMSLEEVEKEHIKRAIRSFGGHMGKAAVALGIDRGTLRRKIAKYNL